MRRTVWLVLLLLTAGGIYTLALDEPGVTPTDGPSATLERAAQQTGGPSLAGSSAGPQTGAAEPGSPPAEEPAHASRWALTASVTDYDDKRPIPGASVRVWLEVAGSRTPIAEGKALADGTLRLDLGRLSELSLTQLGRGRLIGWATAPGYYALRGAPRTIRTLISEDLGPTRWEMEFGLAKSVVLRGRVLNADGSPLHYAGITAIVPENKRRAEEPPEGERRPRQHVFTDADGRYAWPVPRAGDYVVVAGRRDIASTRAEVVTSDGLHDLDLPPITVSSLPAKQGSVVFEDGTPVADMSLEIDHPFFRATSYVWRPRLGPLRVRTDGLGRFNVVLPKMRNFGSRHKAEFKVEIPGIRSKDTGFDAKAGSLKITVKGHRLRLLLRDENKNPLRGQRVSFRVGDGYWNTAEGTTDDRGWVSLFVPLGSKGTIKVVRTGNALLVTSVEVPEIGNESRLVLDVPDSPGTGWLRFIVRTATEDGPYPVKADVESSDGDDVVEQKVVGPEDRIPLASGSYKVSLWSEADDPFGDVDHPFGDGVPDLRARQYLDELCVVRAGETTTVEVRWLDTAALALKFTGHGIEEGELPKSSVILEADGKRRRRVSIVSRHGNHRDGVVVGEWTYSYWRQEPGMYRLVVEAEGFKTVTRNVRLGHNELTRVEIEMERDR